MNTDKEIKKLERKIASLKARSLKTEAKRKKTALSKVIAVVKKFGFDSIHQLLEIADTAAIATSKTRKRTKIDDGMRKRVVAARKSGKTIAETAKIVGISQPSVNNILSKAGLTNSKKKVAKKAAQKKKTVKKAKVTSPKTPAAQVEAPVTA